MAVVSHLCKSNKFDASLKETYTLPPPDRRPLAEITSKKKRKKMKKKKRKKKKKEQEKEEDKEKEKEKEEEGQEAPYNWLTPDRPPLAAFTGISKNTGGCVII